MERAFLLARTGQHDKALADYDDVLRRKPDEVDAYEQRAKIHAGAGRHAQVIADSTEWIRLAPENAAAYNHRAISRFLSGDRAGAIADHTRALELNPEDAPTQNYLAWLLATSPEDHLRNGPRALELAEVACDLTHWENASFLDTLACAYAECGQFDEAVRWVGQVLDLVEEGARAEYEARRELYRAGKPYRCA
jgi:tetratricopeptide (TPR) repeat protein